MVSLSNHDPIRRTRSRFDRLTMTGYSNMTHQPESVPSNNRSATQPMCRNREDPAPEEAVRQSGKCNLTRDLGSNPTSCGSMTPVLGTLFDRTQVEFRRGNLGLYSARLPKDRRKGLLPTHRSGAA